MQAPRPFQTPTRVPLDDLFRRANVEILSGHVGEADEVDSLTDDSRQVQPRGCFVAVRGDRVDGHAHVAEALAAGASAVVVDRDVPAAHDAVVLRVADTRAALARLSAAYFGLVDGDRALRLIGVTGTNGKTTVAWMLRSIFRAAGMKPALLGTIEHDLVGRRAPASLTTPGAVEIARLLAEARAHGATHAVMEASSHALDQKRCDGLAFDACIFMNLSGDHLDYHKTMAAYADAKRRLFALRRAGAPAILNVDDETCRSWVKELAPPVRTFALDDDQADYTAAVESLDRAGCRFRIESGSIRTSIRLSLVGRHNVGNALAAVAAADSVGIDADSIRDGLEHLSTVPGRLQRVEVPDRRFSVFVDYAHTDAALANVLDALKHITPGRLLCVFGCGGDRDRGKRPRMAAAVGRRADVAFVTSDNPRGEDPEAIINEVLTGFDSSMRCRVEVEADRRRAIESAIREARAGDTVLIAGKGHETYQLIGDQVLSFDDADVARSCLQSTGVVEEVA